VQCRESGAEILSVFTACVIQSFLVAARGIYGCHFILVAIFSLLTRNMGGGIRPIAVGFSLGRLALKFANAFGLARFTSTFCPRQLDVGTAGGCDAVIHSAKALS